MTGEKELPAKERLAAYEKVLDEFVSKTGLQTVLYSADIEALLNLDDETIRSMNAEDCAIAASLTARYVINLAKELNRQQVRLNWANRQLDMLVAKEANNYGDKYTKYDQKRNMVIAGDSAAQQLWNIINYAEGRVTELNNQTINVSRYASTLEKVADAKKTSEWAKNRGDR